MSEAGFYVTLPSNSSMELFPENGGGSYKVQLPETLHLNTEYEVGLSEIIFNQDWNAINGEDIWVRVDKQTFTAEEEKILAINDDWKSPTGIWKTKLFPVTPKQMRYSTHIISEKNEYVKFLGSYRYFLNIATPLTKQEFVDNFNTLITTQLDKGEFISTQNLPYLHLSDNGVIDYKSVKIPNLRGVFLMREKFVAYIKSIIDFTKSDKSNEWPRDVVDLEKEREYKINEAVYMSSDDKIKYQDVELFITKVIKPIMEKAFTNGGATSNDLIELKKVKQVNGLKHIQLTINTRGIHHWRLEMSPVLLRILGIQQSQLFGERFLLSKSSVENSTIVSSLIAPLVGEIVPNIERALTSLWIYADIISPHIVGHGKSSLLRVVGIDPKRAAVSTRVNTFTHPHYYPLREHDIREIKITIYNIFGKQPIKFVSPVICQLHFRKIYSPPKPIIKYIKTDPEDRKRLKLGGTIE